MFAAVLLLVALPALAQSDPPSRVGRLSHLEGEVRFQIDPRDEGVQPGPGREDDHRCQAEVRPRAGPRHLPRLTTVIA